MPVENDVGFSEWTPLKMQHFQAIVGMHLKITSAVLRKTPYFRQAYHYIDATAGPGQYTAGSDQIRGSPLLFLDAAEALKIAYHADLIELKQANADSLKKHLPPIAHANTVNPYCCDYTQGCSVLENVQFALFCGNLENQDHHRRMHNAEELFVQSQGTSP